jgi:hypothetical protein
MTTRRFGTLGSDSAPVEETIRCSSISTPGSGMMSEPVAMTIDFAFTSSVLPSLSATCTVSGAVMRPLPLM